MKAFLLAAGYGTRLRPITDRIPKCMVPIQGRPLLSIWLELCRKYHVDEILINLHSHGAMVQEYVAENHNGLNIQIFEEPTLLGSAGTIAANREWVSSESSFWVFFADVLTNINLERMVRFHRSHDGAATLGVYEVSEPRRCGITMIDQAGLIHEFLEKPTNPPCTLAFSGILMGTRVLLDSIPPQLPADLGFDVLPRLAGRMFAYRIREYLVDIGTLENYAAAQNTWPGL